VNPISKVWLLRRQKYVRKRNGNEGLCLDIGCGENPIYDSCIRVDIKKCGDIQASAEHLPFREASFNTVFCLDMIEHLTHPTQFLHETNRVLTENGKLVVTTPNKHSFLWKLIWFGWTHTVSKRERFDKHMDKFHLAQLKEYFKLLRLGRVNLFLHYIEAQKK